MDIDQAIETIKTVLPNERVEHSIRVADVAIKLANCYHIDIEKIQLAAILHDYAKNHTSEEMRQWILNSALSKDLLFYHSAIWHGPVGALILKVKHGVHDRDILNAIHSHTTGRPHMSLFEKIIFVADYIEPARRFPGIDKIREVAFKQIDQATYMILQNMIQYLMSKEQTVYPSTFYAYNELTKI